MNILDNPLDLMNLSDDEINEALLDSKYNIQNLRELTRRTLKILKAQKEISDYYSKKADKLESKINKSKELLECQE